MNDILVEVVKFLLNEHLKGDPVDEAAQARFAQAKAHLDALEPKVTEAPVAVPPSAPKVPSVVVVTPVPQVPPVEA